MEVCGKELRIKGKLIRIGSIDGERVPVSRGSRGSIVENARFASASRP